MAHKVVAIVGSYRKAGTIDSAVQAILSAAREKGAETHTLYLTDQHLEFCTNCRRCTQAPGLQRGCCVQQDDLQTILTEIDRRTLWFWARRSTTGTSPPSSAGLWSGC